MLHLQGVPGFIAGCVQPTEEYLEEGGRSQGLVRWILWIWTLPPPWTKKKRTTNIWNFSVVVFFVEKGEGGGVVKYLIYPVVLSFRMHGRCGWSFPKDGRYSMVFVGADSLISIIGPPETRWFPCIPCEPVKSSHFHETWCWDFHKESLKLYELYDCLTEMMRYKSKIIENSSKTKFPLPINGSCLALPWELWEGFGLFSRTHRKGHHFRSVPSASEDAGRLKTVQKCMVKVCVNSLWMDYGKLGFTGLDWWKTTWKPNDL